MSDFQSLGLSAPLLKALAAEGYQQPTPIQAAAIPIVRTGKDLLGLAQTGTGKTAAFALPILDRLAASQRAPRPKSCRALVLAPTRELAAQIGESFRVYGKFIGLTSTVIYGGVGMGAQRAALARGVDILVATPGRLLDHAGEHAISLRDVEILVLDEADHMLDMGFIHALRRIAKMLPQKRQSLFFSATMPNPIAELAAQFLTAPERVAVTPVSSTAERVAQSVIFAPQPHKQALLHAILADRSITRALVFSRTKHGANRIAEKLEEAGFPAEAIHGNKSQNQRERALANFKSGAARLLVATEVAARGIDVDDVSHVINFDLPNVPEQYVHRIGRTARAGATGEAISFCAPDERAFLRDIEKLTGQKVPVRQNPLGEGKDVPVDLVEARRQQAEPKRGTPHRRPQRRDRPRPDHPKADRPHRDGPRADGARSETGSAQRDGAERRAREGAHGAEAPARRKGQEVWSNSGPPQKRKQGPGNGQGAARKRR